MNTRPLRRRSLAPRFVLIIIFFTLFIGSVTIVTDYDTRAFAAPNSPAIAAGQFQFDIEVGGQLRREGEYLYLLVRRTGGNEGMASVNVSVTGGTATADADFRFAPTPSGNFAQTSPTSGTFTSPNGTNGSSLYIQLLRDTIDEPDETIELTLSDPTGGVTLGSQTTAVLTIVNDNRIFAEIVSPSSYRVNEGDSGTQDFPVTISLSAPPDKVVTVDYKTNPGLGFPPPTPNIDFVSLSGTLVFAPGETTKTVTVQIKGDLIDERDAEDIYLVLSNGVNAIAGDSFAYFRIIDNDPPVFVSIDDVTIVEGSGLGFMTLTLSGPTETGYIGDLGVFVKVRAVNGTAKAGQDFEFYDRETIQIYPPTSGLVQRIQFFIKPDTIAEPRKEFYVEIERAEFATIERGRATVTILDDDVPNVAGLLQFTGDTFIGREATQGNLALMPGVAQLTIVRGRRQWHGDG